MQRKTLVWVLIFTLLISLTACKTVQTKQTQNPDAQGHPAVTPWHDKIHDWQTDFFYKVDLDNTVKTTTTTIR